VGFREFCNHAEHDGAEGWTRVRSAAPLPRGTRIPICPRGPSKVQGRRLRLGSVRLRTRDAMRGTAALKAHK
jgi:hypothetical protein